MSKSASLFVRGFMIWTYAPQTLGIGVLKILDDQLANSKITILSSYVKWSKPFIISRIFVIKMFYEQLTNSYMSV